jgi:hypothetical protein
MHGFGERYKRIQNLIAMIKIEAVKYPMFGNMIDHCIILVSPPSFSGFRKVDDPLLRLLL